MKLKTLLGHNLEMYILSCLKIFGLKSFAKGMLIDLVGVFMFTLSMFLVNILYCVQANGIKIGPQHSPNNPGMPSGGGGGTQGGGCC